MFLGSFETYINPNDGEAYSKMKEDDRLMTVERMTTNHDSWHPELSSFQKLILIKCCKEEKVGCFFIKEMCYNYFTKAHQPVMIQELIRFV